MKKLLPQSKKKIEAMIKAGFPICLGKGDWSGDHKRHCNACIEEYKKRIRG